MGNDREEEEVDQMTTNQFRASLLTFAYNATMLKENMNTTGSLELLGTKHPGKTLLFEREKAIISNLHRRNARQRRSRTLSALLLLW